MTALTAIVLVVTASGRELHAAEAASESAQSAAADKEWIVVLTDPRSSRRKGWSAGVGYAGSYSYVDNPKLKRLASEVADDYPVEITDQWPVRSLNVHCVVVRITEDPDATLLALQADERVEWVQPLNTFEGLSTDALKGAGELSGDPYRHLQASLEMLNVDPVRSELSGAGVRVVVVDSGVEPDHPDLRHALAERVDFVGKGRPSERHGTGIAGVVVAADGNGVGIVGVAPGARLHAYRACWEVAGGKTRCNSLTLSQALDHVVETSPHIVNLSLTGPKDLLLDRLVDRVLSQGALVVVAYDPSSRPNNRFPTPRRGIVTVRDGSGVYEIGEGALYAPGDTVLTAQPGHSYDFMTGASLAAAHVSGVLALMLEADPSVAADETIMTLAQSIRSADTGSSIDACVAISNVRSTLNCR